MNPHIHKTTSRLFTAIILIGLLSIASAQNPTEPAARPIDSIPAPAISLAAKDRDALRIWFHQPQFNISDGLDVYNDDFRNTIDISTAISSVRQNTIQSLTSFSPKMGTTKTAVILRDKQ